MDKTDHIQKLSSHPPQGSSHLGFLSTTSKLLIRIFCSLSTFSSTTHCEPPATRPLTQYPHHYLYLLEALATLNHCLLFFLVSGTEHIPGPPLVFIMLLFALSHPPHFLAWPALPTKEVTLLTPTSKGTWHPAPIPLSNLIFLPLL